MKQAQTTASHSPSALPAPDTRARVFLGSRSRLLLGCVFASTLSVGVVAAEHPSRAASNAVSVEAAQYADAIMNAVDVSAAPGAAAPLASAPAGHGIGAGAIPEGAAPATAASCDADEAARIAKLAATYQCKEGTEQRILESDFMKEVGCMTKEGRWHGLTKVWRKNSPTRIVAYETGEDRGYVQLFANGSPSMIGKREAGNLVCRRGWNANGTEVPQVRIPQQQR
jgi:hypothetical protein